jgi:type II secretory pathway component PulK
MNSRESIISLRRNNRGVALLIVLLVTALLIALVFEFSYATRISLNSAINFRDSQRAYFLARSGVIAFVKYGNQLRDYFPQSKGFPLHEILGMEDAIINVTWEDETGKIKITDVKTDAVTKYMIQNLFESVKGIDTGVYDRITADTSDVNTLTLLSGLRKFMNEADFTKVSDSLTVSPVPSHRININAASKDVLRSLGIESGTAELIIQSREKELYTDLSGVPGIANIQINHVALSNYLTVTPGAIYKVISKTRVGEYEKQVEAVINGSTISSWRVW